MDSFLKDIRYAIRSLLKHPGFTAIAVLTLALGIGASTSIFTVVNAGLLRGLPYKEPGRLYHLFETTPQKEFGRREFSYPDYQDYQQNQVCEAIAAYTGGGGVLTGQGEPQRVVSPSVSANFFSLLGIAPMLGRTFLPGEDKPGGAQVTVLTYPTWQRLFGGDAGIVGKPLTINGRSYTVIGVLPPSFQFAFQPADLWLPYQPTEAQLTRRFMHGTNLIARLKPGVTAAQAQSDLGLITARIAKDYDSSHAGTGLAVVQLQESVVGQVKPILLILLGAVGFVLLIACANVASLLLTRSLARQKEVTIRAALGATRGRLIRQLLTESLLLSLVGGLFGLALAYFGVGAMVKALPEAQLNALPFLSTLKIDTGILAFSMGLSFLTGFVFGLGPALQSSHLDLNQVLKEGGRQGTGGAGHRLRSALVTTEIALAVVLLVGAGLMMKSLLHLLQANVGFKTDHLLTMTVIAPPAKYGDAIRQESFNQQLTERLRSLPGVKDAGTVNILPISPGNTTRFNIEGDPSPPPGQEVEANIRNVSDTYFQTLGISLVAGRVFDQRDKADAPGVVIIGKSVADRMFSGRDPVGRRITYTGTQAPSDLIVGVVSDVRITGLDEAIKPVLYYPFRQSPSPFANLVVRTSADPNSLAATVRNEIRSVEPDVAVFNVSSMDELISSSPASFMRRFPALLISIFACLALLLASIGIYGVVSYSVSQQTHQIGVRMALGAQASDILKMVLRQGLVLALVGVGIGVAAAMALTRLLKSLLYEVQATDPATFAIVAGVLFAVALLACYLPARRATKVDPLTALRYE